MIVGVDLDKLPADKRKLVEKMDRIFNSKVSGSKGIHSIEKKITNVTVEEMLQQFTI